MAQPAAAEQAAAQAAHAPRASRFRIVDRVPSLDEVDHGLVLDYEEYKDRLKKQQKRLNKLEMEMYQRVPLVLMFEGWDAAGKGGAIKRVAQALDARAYTIFPSPAPTKPELAHPHLWRYWTRLPKAGHVGIYDRSWYGRVLVERVEGFATDAQWARAYDEINEFEQELVRWGAVLLKFWVDVSQEEQLARFRARQEDPAKQWKITDEDWRSARQIPAVQKRRRGHVPPDVHAVRAVDCAGIRRQALRPRQGARGHQRCARGAVTCDSEVKSAWYYDNHIRCRAPAGRRRPAHI